MLDAQEVAKIVEEKYPIFSRTLNMEKKEDPDAFLDGRLGGCAIKNDLGTYYPLMWKQLVDELDAKSVVDVGCGFGYALSYFTEDLGLDGVGIEGSSKVTECSPLKDLIIVNDYEKSSPALPKDKIFDFAWCCEFLEHVRRDNLDKIFDTFLKCKYVAITFARPGQTGHNHVNCKNESYWVRNFEDRGFSMELKLTEKLRKECRKDYQHFQRSLSPDNRWWEEGTQEGYIDGKQTFFMPHFIYRGLIFKNNFKK